MTIIPQNSPDSHLFGHTTANSVNLTQSARISCIFFILSPIPVPPLNKKSSASRISANPSICTQLTLLTHIKPRNSSYLHLKSWYPASEQRNKYRLPKIQTTIYICLNLNLHHTNFYSKTREIQINHPSCRIHRCNSVSNREPGLTGYISLTNDKKTVHFSASNSLFHNF